jgi:hypothetical protein
MAFLGLLVSMTVYAFERDAYPTSTTMPVFPDALLGGPKDKDLCRVIVEIAPEGTVRQVQHEDCAGELSAAVNAGIEQWTWGKFEGRAMAPISVGMREPAKSAIPTSTDSEMRPWDDYRPIKLKTPAFADTSPAPFGERYVTCFVEASITRDGRPTSVAASNCGTTFQEDIATAMLDWKWPKHELEGTVRVQKKIRFRYWKNG